MEPKIKSEKLSEICGDLADVTGMPSMSSERNKPLAMHIESLNAVLLRYNERLIKQSRKKHQDRDNSSDLQPDEEKSTETSCEFIKKVPGGKVEDRYVILDEYLSKMEQYEYVSLDDFTPLNRYKRREYIKKLKLSRSVNLYRVAYGGCVGTLSFIWVVPNNDSEERILKNSTIIKVLTEKLPKFSNRQMRRDFINKYFSFVKCPKSVLRNMYFEISGYETSYESTDQRVIDERVAEKLLYSDDPKLLFDLRSTNGSDTVYDKFYTETAHYFDEQIMHVHERRKADELYMPLCISLEDLREQMKKRLPEDTPFPTSTESLRLQFTPANQFSRTALKYSSKLNVKFRVQTRLARVYHQDAHYVAAYYKYMKEFMVTFRDNTVFVCLDDKAIVPVGEPGIPICTGVRGHNKVLTPADGAKLVGTDHDFHIGGIVPSVVLVSNIPESKDDSFFSGNIYVTTKDKVFEPSSPFRHATEVVRILQENYSESENSDKLKCPILCILTDGGPDHRLTYDSVKASLLEIFFTLKLNVLVALRTAPSHSWMNPAERCMSILNLALQHVSLCREEMPAQYEKMIKGKVSLAAVRNQGDVYPEFKKAFSSSVEPTIDMVNKRFERMKLKGENLRVYRGASKEQIERNVDKLKLATGSDQSSFDSASKSKDFKKDVPLQIRKCSDSTCQHCSQNPVRDEALFEKVSALPEPTPDNSGAHYLPFKEVYGKSVTSDKFRPSTKHADFDDESVEEDKRNRDVLKAEKARDVIKCAECHKPRVIYCASKTNRTQDDLLRQMREDKIYTCGDPVEDLGLVMRRTINCVSDVEMTYYSSSFSKYCPPVCCYCGTEDELLDDSDPYMEDLFTKFSKVRPLCKKCHDNGVEAKTWGKKFSKKKRNLQVLSIGKFNSQTLMVIRSKIVYALT